MNELIRTLRGKLSTRTLNCIAGEGIETLEQLRNYEKAKLLKIPGFGKKTLAELDSFFDRRPQEPNNILLAVSILRKNGYKVEKLTPNPAPTREN